MKKFMTLAVVALVSVAMISCGGEKKDEKKAADAAQQAMQMGADLMQQGCDQNCGTCPKAATCSNADAYGTANAYAADAMAQGSAYAAEAYEAAAAAAASSYEAASAYANDAYETAAAAAASSYEAAAAAAAAAYDLY